MESQKKLIIVTGVSNVIGQEFMRYYSYYDDYVVIGLSRSKCEYGFRKAIALQVDLLDKQQIESSLQPYFRIVPWQLIRECMIIHTAGKAKNDGIHMIIDADKDGIDDTVYHTQLTTFDNLHEFLVNYLTQEGVYRSIKITVVALASIIDEIESPIHFSMRSVNNLMRKKLQELTSQRSHYHAVILSTSTIATKVEVEYRKYADQTYWLHGCEVVDKAIPSIEDSRFGYHDVKIYKHHPLYHSYFKNETIAQLVARFKREIGLKETP